MGRRISLRGMGCVCFWFLPALVSVCTHPGEFFIEIRPRCYHLDSHPNTCRRAQCLVQSPRSRRRREWESSLEIPPVRTDSLHLDPLLTCVHEYRLSGYFLFPFLLITIHLAGGYADWVHMTTSETERFWIYLVLPLVAFLGVVLRMRYAFVVKSDLSISG